ncbi:hypothetical protein Naga_102101g1 [Nannochloropsis gaditana]|uniref:Uncharacterized protein n=1 Tax=Nannochloropsis gaditana TaxID=72520 RepID=W7T976_9STRA|nr:hypothetical protein Naga_102101g1 [Nannochloropsis gaditana]
MKEVSAGAKNQDPTPSYRSLPNSLPPFLPPCSPSSIVPSVSSQAWMFSLLPSLPPSLSPSLPTPPPLAHTPRFSPQGDRERAFLVPHAPSSFPLSHSFPALPPPLFFFLSPSMST